ncbi:hypothetical protein GOB16_12020 [Sinorhizobium meliloti]|nr:hypothetical protein [Sinorhizobium meliloti]
MRKQEINKNFNEINPLMGLFLSWSGWAGGDFPLRQSHMAAALAIHSTRGTIYYSVDIRRGYILAVELNRA